MAIEVSVQVSPIVKIRSDRVNFGYFGELRKIGSFFMSLHSALPFDIILTSLNQNLDEAANVKGIFFLSAIGVHTKEHHSLHNNHDFSSHSNRFIYDMLECSLEKAVSIDRNIWSAYLLAGF